MLDKIKKAKKEIDKIIQKAKDYRNTHGYRENLGYDSIGDVEAIIFLLQMTYSEECAVIAYFYNKCDNI